MEIFHNMFLVKMILYTKNWCFVVGSVCLKRASVKQNFNPFSSTTSLSFMHGYKADNTM